MRLRQETLERRQGPPGLDRKAIVETGGVPGDDAQGRQEPRQAQGLIVAVPFALGRIGTFQRLMFGRVALKRLGALGLRRANSCGGPSSAQAHAKPDAHADRQAAFLERVEVFEAEPGASLTLYRRAERHAQGMGAIDHPLQHLELTRGAGGLGRHENKNRTSEGDVKPQVASFPANSHRAIRRLRDGLQRRPVVAIVEAGQSFHVSDGVLSSPPSEAVCRMKKSGPATLCMALSITAVSTSAIAEPAPAAAGASTAPWNAATGPAPYGTKPDEARRLQAVKDSYKVARRSKVEPGNGWYRYNPKWTRQENCNTMLANGQTTPDAASNPCRRD